MQDTKPPLRKCKHCKHEWNYKGSLTYFCCPCCLSKGRHPKAGEKK